ncbi:glycosyltransferase family 4 protein [Mesorhizobium sp. B2-4-19]|uniref:glycosyltransferase n=1 Tax=Mesorhizobium sp. B2-4-19 TaxID=2589930 RepID=UPI001125D618|nr:glycosyltransferase [Mesorhizobium sp. B2-4-19]TPK53359.1 glycosyltransferase family 4 protein [Mesorhizobium sp. B2-4-19]
MRILQFLGMGWAFGSVHSELTRYLHQRGIVSDMLDWSKTYPHSDMEMMKEYYDYFYGIPGETWPLTDNYGIPHNKIVVVAHGDYDLHHAITARPPEEMERFAEYAVVSEFLRDLSIAMGIKRIPKVVKLGVNYRRFFRPIADELRVVGYGGSMHRADHQGIDLKRGHLAKEATEAAGLVFSPAGQFHYLAMPHYYGSVQAVLVTSIKEGFGLPALEAAAAGRLVISTPVGEFPRQAALGAGLTAPLDDEAFKEFAIERLTYYKNHPGAYKEYCHEIQNSVKKLDWEFVIDDWINLFARRI